MTFDIERELARAMSAEAETLSPPKIDLARIRRRSRPRRLVLPTIILATGAAAAAPMAAISHNGAVGSHPVGDVVGPVYAATTSPRPAPASITPPSPAGVPGEQADAVRVPTATASATCWTASRALTAGDRAGVVRQVQAAAADAEAKLERQLAGVAEVRLPDTELAALVPPAGAMVEHTGCGDDDARVSEATVQEAVKKAESVVAALTGVLRDTLGKLGVTNIPVTIAIEAGEGGATTVRLEVDGGAAVTGTITATVGPGGAAVETDTSSLLVDGVPAPTLPELPGLPSVPEPSNEQSPSPSQSPGQSPGQSPQSSPSPQPLVPGLPELPDLPLAPG